MSNLLEKPLLHATLGDFVEAMRLASSKDEEREEPRLVHGIAGLAALLGCSIPTAQKIKNSGEIPFSQQGRKVVFEAEKVLKALAKK
jgi:hypothetical protein